MSAVSSPPEGHPHLDDQTRELLTKQLDRYTAIIGRLASNSVQAKTWCLTAVAAIAALAVQSKDDQVLWVGVPVILVFAALDTYYLSLERGFRTRSNDIGDNVQDGLTWADLVVVSRPPEATSAGHLAASVRSATIWPFYGLIASVLLVALLVA